MNVVWTITLIAIAGASAKLLLWLRGRGRVKDLGFVSPQWISEHRASYASDG